MIPPVGLELVSRKVFTDPLGLYFQQKKTQNPVDTFFERKPIKLEYKLTNCFGDFIEGNLVAGV